MVEIEDSKGQIPPVRIGRPSDPTARLARLRPEFTAKMFIAACGIDPIEGGPRQILVAYYRHNRNAEQLYAVSQQLKGELARVHKFAVERSAKFFDGSYYRYHKYIPEPIICAYLADVLEVAPNKIKHQHADVAEGFEILSGANAIRPDGANRLNDARDTEFRNPTFIAMLRLRRSLLGALAELKDPDSTANPMRFNGPYHHATGIVWPTCYLSVAENAVLAMRLRHLVAAKANDSALPIPTSH